MSTDNDQQGPDAAAESTQDGQVSEVSGMSGEPDAIDPSDAVAGTPEGESGEPQEGTAGPNAAPRHDPPEPTNRSSR